jgi:hypothetical protein
MSKQQTSVEWLVEQLKTKYDINIERLSVTDKAKAMHEQQIIVAYLSDRFPCSDEDAEQYYNETYKK